MIDLHAVKQLVRVLRARLAKISVTPKPFNESTWNFRQEWIKSYIKRMQNFSSIGKSIHARKKNWPFFLTHPVHWLICTTTNQPVHDLQSRLKIFWSCWLQAANSHEMSATILIDPIGCHMVEIITLAYQFFIHHVLLRRLSPNARLAVLGYSQACAVVISCFASVVLFNFRPSYLFLTGTGLVCLSIYMYSALGVKPNLAVLPSKVLRQL